ncbi:MAG TPA: TIGR04290 family methyltransferase [Opitutaceae bacterium]|nr:TIGR04290 family methyltransferase [Opitutaceae bacterium]
MSEAAYMIRPKTPATGLAAEAAQFAPWFHNLHLPDGTQTAPDHPLGDFPSSKWAAIGPSLPADLSGWTALDIGCNSGFYAIELARRGAQVTAIDHDPHFLRQARWAVDQYGVADRIELRAAHLYELARWHESYDLVLFLGVFYHLRYPLLGLDLVAERVRRKLVFQTFTMPDEASVVVPDDFGIDERERLLAPGWPKLAFIEKQLAGDVTNWWAPNHACIEAMLRTCGLEVRAHPAHEIYVCEPSGEGDAVARSVAMHELLAATGRRRVGLSSTVREPAAEE